MNTSIIPKFIVNLFKHEIERVHKVLLYEISKDYNIPYTDLEKRYISNVNLDEDKKISGLITLTDLFNLYLENFEN